MRSFYFIRHGQTDWNVQGRMQGNTDIPLNDTGREQARHAALRVKNTPVDMVVSSPLQRAWHTAEAIAEALGVEAQSDARLRERGFGAFEGLTKQEILTRHNLSENDDYGHVLPQDAESWQSTKERMQACMQDWLQKHPQSTILFVSHGAAFRALHEALSGHIMYADNATPYIFEYAENNWIIRLLSDEERKG